MLARKLVIVLLVVVFVVPTLAFHAPVAAQGEFLFWIFGEQGDVDIQEGDSVFLVTGWAVCRAPGLIKDYQNAFGVELVVDGAVVLDGSVQTTRPYWLPTELWGEDDPVCNNHADKIYGVWWMYDLSGLVQEPGTYTLAWVATQKHQVTDLVDGYYFVGGTLIEPDGRPDKYPPSTFEWSVTLTVS